ncbi:MAG: hypothetical protein J6X85_03510 [Ruminococcus sp.]|nr:hypothetical protein [Ruminococcus sp.]
MKKALTIGGAVLGALLISALVMFIFCPGLPTYLKVKHKYEHIDEKLSAFETMPAEADLSDFTVNGIKLKAPADCSSNLNEHGLKSASGKAELLVIKRDNKGEDELLDSMQNYDPWDTYKFNKEDYAEFFRTIGVEPVQYGFSSRIIFYIRDYIDSKDCIDLRGQNKDIFLELADIKEKAVETETMYKLSGNSFTVYIGRINLSGYEDMWNIYIYPDSDDIHNYSIALTCPDETMARQIISSIELE